MTISAEFKSTTLIICLIIFAFGYFPIFGQVTPAEQSIHNAGNKLLETELFELYAQKELGSSVEMDSNGCWTHYQGGRQVSISLVFKVEPDFIITDDAAYKRRFENEIFPIIKQKCNPATILIDNYVKGVRIGNYTKKEFQYNENIQKDNPYEGEASLSRIVVNVNDKGEFSYLKVISFGNSLADYREKQGFSRGIKEGKRFHNAGEKLLETDLYELYFNGASGCDYTSAQVVLIFKVTTNYIVTDSTFRQIFEKEILPAVERKCDSLRSIKVLQYVKGVRIGNNNKIYSYEQSLPSEVRETYLNSTEITINKKNPASYQYEREYLDVASLTDYRKRFAEVINTTTTINSTKNSYLSNFTSDGKLNLTGISKDNKIFFHLIYDGEFAELSVPDEDEYMPYGMFSGFISQYGDICRSSLSPSAIEVPFYDTRQLGTTYSPFGRTEYYETYLAKIVYMEPKYEAMYRTTPLIALQRMYEYSRQTSGKFDLNVLVSITESSLKLIPLALDSQQLISENKCGSPAMIRFINNLHNFVSGNWDAKTKNGYLFTEREYSSKIKRNHPKVPPTFSPDFLIPSGKIIEVTLNSPYAPQEYGTYLSKSQGLRMIVVEKLGRSESLVNELNKKLVFPTPQYVWDALREQKYYVARCNYLLKSEEKTEQKDFYFWVAQGPLPSTQVQSFLKDIIREPRTSCPAIMPIN